MDTLTQRIGGGTVDTWLGYTRYCFTSGGNVAWVAEPRHALPGNPWARCLEFPEAFTDRCAAPMLLERGYHFAHLSLFNNFGAPGALCQFDAFYAHLTAAKLARRTVLIGISRGGLSAYRWAAANPQQVSVIYGDAPVCDFKSWPGGKGRGSGSAGDWAACQRLYGFADEAEALAYVGNPVDTLTPLAHAGVALIHVVGEEDTVVPVVENTAVVEDRYWRLGGAMTVIRKPGVGHHPHGLEDPAPVVDFILTHDRQSRSAEATL